MKKIFGIYGKNMLVQIRDFLSISTILKILAVFDKKVVGVTNYHPIHLYLIFNLQKSIDFSNLIFQKSSTDG